jgi:type IV fimbrial biogenesis protein FimT
MKKSNDGYSLFELLMTLGIFAIVMTLGLPSMGNMVASHRLRVEIDMLFHAVHLARKESVVRRRVVTICPTRDGENCEPTNDWTVGWMMFVNHDRSNAGTR